MSDPTKANTPDNATQKAPEPAPGNASGNAQAGASNGMVRNTSGAAKYSLEIAVVMLILGFMVFWAARFAAYTINMWALILVAVGLFVCFLGRWISGRLMGIFIGSRNLMSLSRFQMVLWTVLILSAYFTMALHRVRDGAPVDPLAIGMDWHLWALMGISTASLIGSPLLLGSKADKQADQKSVDKAAAALKESAKDIEGNSAGTLYVNKTIADASFLDIFQGDEIGNTAYVDPAKMQMFLFTVIALIAYGAAVAAMLRKGDYSAMPVPSEGLIALLGISHAGYLASKTTDQTTTK
jgi:hypothetical protein